MFDSDVDVTGRVNKTVPDCNDFIENGRLIIPEGVEYVLEENCHGREDLEKIVMPSSMKVIGPVAFAECPNLRKVTLNEGLEEIGDGAFLGAALMTKIELPSTLKNIGPMAFYGCGISEITVPESVESIGEYCFWECPDLARADILNPGCVIGEDIFGDCPKLVEGYIAAGFPKDDIPATNMLFSVLWASSYDRHQEHEVMVDEEERRYYTSLHIHVDDPRGRQTVSERAMANIRREPGIILERILKTNNQAAMRGIIEYNLFDSTTIDEGLQSAVASGQTELASLFLAAKSHLNGGDSSDSPVDEFEL